MAKKNLKPYKILKNKTQNTWVKAKKLIPGGNMLLSKRPEMFLPISGLLTIKKQKAATWKI